MKPTVITIISSPHVSGDSVLQKLVIITVHCGTVDDKRDNAFFIYKRINCCTKTPNYKYKNIFRNYKINGLYLALKSLFYLLDIDDSSFYQLGILLDYRFCMKHNTFVFNV